MSENDIKIEFNSNLEEYTKLIEKLQEQTLALKATSEEVDGFEVRFELKEHEQLPEYDLDEAAKFIKAKLVLKNESFEELPVGVIQTILDYEEDYMRTQGIIED